MVDLAVRQQLKQCQILRPNVDLSQPRRTSHGLFWYNLHIVLVHRARLGDIRIDTLNRVRDMVLRASLSKGYLLSRCGILPDHVHLTLGCPMDVAPEDVAIGFLNNLSYAHGMKAVYQYGAFIGTFGEYTNYAMRSDLDHRPTETSSDAGERGGERRD
jgi:hypothetical protein